jgi:hypothetical protein
LILLAQCSYQGVAPFLFHYESSQEDRQAYQARDDRIRQMHEAGASSVRLHGDHYIACPAAWFLDLLAKFYGRPITLPHQSTDPTEPAEAQS